MVRQVIVLFLALCAWQSVKAQGDSLTIIELAPVPVSALRIPTPPLKQPFSIANYQAGTLQEIRQQLSLQEYLNHIPGLFSLNANNYAQDLRISIRGFGARSAFGIRGVKIVVDGIPETTPDGQGQIDNLNLGIVERIEVLKGPSSALYGNASGGVINIHTQERFSRNFLEAGLTFGAFNRQQYQLKGGFAKNKTKLMVQGTHTQSDGYRAWSRLQNTNLNLRLWQQFSRKSKLNLQVNYTKSPIGDDPGGLKEEEVQTDRRMARQRNLDFKTGEAIGQFKIGSRYQHQVDSSQSFQIYGFYSRRNFEGRLPFSFGGWVDLQRDYWGQGGHYKSIKGLAKGENTLQVGYEWAFQNDLRRRFFNEKGSRGATTLNQTESFSNLGVYVLDHFQIQKWLFTAGLRFDHNHLEVKDQKLDDGDQSGQRNLPAFNASLGLNYQLNSSVHLYANYRSSFETPTLSELSANPSGEAGFNPLLESQRAYNYEIGIKGLLFDRMDFDATFFFIQTQNDLVPFELPAFPDRSFFRNAGNTRRQGLEFSSRYQFTSSLSLKGSYTFSRFIYQEYTIPSGDFKDNFLPGIPQHLASLILTYQSEKGFNSRLQHRFVSPVFTNDANAISASAYHLTDCSIGYCFTFPKIKWIPFFGINNIFDTQYNDNIRINAFGSRYYEPAPGVNVYGGIRVKGF